MNCPKCGEELAESYLRVVQPRRIAKAAYGKKTERQTKKREAYMCVKCNKVYVWSYALVEVEVVDK